MLIPKSRRIEDGKDSTYPYQQCIDDRRHDC